MDYLPIHRKIFLDICMKVCYNTLMNNDDTKHPPWESQAPRRDNKFRNSLNKLYTKSLFFETTLADKSSVVYTLKAWDHLSYPSLERLYLEVADPTEYRFAKAHLDGWTHWRLLSSLEWFKPYVQNWRHELSVKLKSESISKIQDIARGTGRDSLTAAKTLLDLVGSPGRRSTAGRPPKDQEEVQAAQATLEARLVAEDVFRLKQELN